jgi:methylated-DNA-protein-cysteine methyltransferase related protein
MDVFIVLTSTLTFPSHVDRNFLQKIKIMAKRKNSTKPKEKLANVKPSGKTDTNFFEQVYEVVRQIPKGKVTSYGAIGKCLGAQSSARMVGWAMNGAGHIKPAVPAHRVVNRNGMLTGKQYFSPPEKMQQLLEREGIKIVNDKVADFKKHFWDPSEELF